MLRNTSSEEEIQSVRIQAKIMTPFSKPVDMYAMICGILGIFCTGWWLGVKVFK